MIKVEVGKMTELFNIPRGSRIGVKHLGLILESNNQLVSECVFESLDGSVGRCIIEGNFLLMYAITEVIYLGPVKTDEL